MTQLEILSGTCGGTLPLVCRAAAAGSQGVGVASNTRLGTNVGPPLRRRFERQLRADCALLEALRVMDYSLLLGIHSRSGGGLASTPQHTDAVRPRRLLGAAHPGTGEHCASSSPCC
jgi:Phosphatidylinositol-4-phosphate 5-Kinase